MPMGTYLAKLTCATILALISTNTAFAQNRNNIYAELGCTNLGMSATFDRKVFKHLDIGAGVLTNYYSSEKYNKVRSALYLDIRPFWKIRKSLLFLPVDVGLALIGGPQPVHYSVSPAGFYVGTGFGYGYMINKRGMGPYISINLQGYTLNYVSHDVNLNPAAKDYAIFDAFGQIALGFKF
jgi:hypothetical protein